jgi:hypothetical protein
VLGVPVTAQAVALFVSVLCIAVLVGLAVLNWLERLP